MISNALKKAQARIAELERINKVLLFTIQQLGYPAVLLKADLDKANRTDSSGGHSDGTHRP